MNLTQAITQASQNPDIDSALGPIQQLLGVTTGDVAGRVFSSSADHDALNSDYWPDASPEERHAALMQYVSAEIGHMGGGRTESVQEAFDPYTDPTSKRMLELAGLATYRHRR